MKLVFFGDSSVWGQYGGNFVAEIARRLPQHEIINAGEAGNTALNLLRRFDDDVLTHDPDGVFIMIGGNDAISYSQPETRPYYKKSMGIPDGVVTPTLFAQTYRELLTRLQLAHIEVWVGLGPAEYNPAVVEAKREYNAISADMARSMNIPVLDLMTPLTPQHIPDRPPISLKFIDTIGQRAKSDWNDYAGEQQRNGYTYTFDGLHLTLEAAGRVADLIIEFLGLR